MDDSGGCNLEVVIDRLIFSARDLKRKMDFARNNNYRLKNEPELMEFRDTQKIRDLEKENTELRQALEDHQYGLEFIMSKYRSQVIELIQLNKAEKNVTPPETMSIRRNNSVD